MNFIGNKLIPAALFAATASVVMAAPAHSLSLVPGSSFSFDSKDETPVDATFDGSTLDFDFVEALNGETSGSTGSFIDGDIQFYDFSVSGITPNFFPGGGSLDNDPVTFITGISTNLGAPDDSISFVLTDVANVFVSDTSYTFTLLGDFVGSDPTDPFAGYGSFTGQYDLLTDTWSGNLRAVPTPAAVLPILTGLFGAASRKKNEEEEA